VFNVLFVGYSLAKNNLNNTYQYNMIPKHFSKTIRITTVTLGYCLLTDKQKITNKIRKSVYGGIGCSFNILVALPMEIFYFC
jgi:hypothetical protein